MDSATKPTPSILIVEDDEATRVGLYHLLSGNGYRVQAATNGREALSLLQNNAIPLILSDLNMPVMDGYELVQTLRSHPSFKMIPVIIMSSHLNQAQALSADGYIAKPYAITDLMQLLQQTLANR